MVDTIGALYRRKSISIYYKLARKGEIILTKKIDFENRFGISPEINNSFIRSIPDDQLLTPADVSNITGLSARQIRRYCENGQLRSYCFGRKYVIYGVDFKSYMKESLMRHRTFRKLLN